MLSYNDLISGFKRTGIKRGDTIMVHTAYKSLGGVEGGAETVVNALVDLVGPDGTALFPAFNFQSWTETHYFDAIETPSRMGIITELARLRADSLRTPHPIYSFSVIGRLKEEFAQCDDQEAYGENSVFALFHHINGTILSIGLDFNNTFSMHHYIEHRVGCDYRRTKKFSGIYVGYEGIPEIRTYTMFVRKNQQVKTYIIPGMNDLLKAGVIKEIKIGDALIHWATAEDFYDNMSEIVREEPNKLHYIEKFQS